MQQLHMAQVHFNGVFHGTIMPIGFRFVLTSPEGWGDAPNVFQMGGWDTRRPLLCSCACPALATVVTCAIGYIWLGWPHPYTTLSVSLRFTLLTVPHHLYPPLIITKWRPQAPSL